MNPYVRHEMYCDKFVFGLHNDAMGAELLKTHFKADNTTKSIDDVVTEAKAMESALESAHTHGEF